MTSPASPRRVGARPGRHRAQGPQRSWPLALAILVAVAFVAACTSTTSSPTASGTPASPGSPGPKPTQWPTTTVEAAIALGAADGDFKPMADDVVAAVNAEDPHRMLQVMDDAIEFLTKNQVNIPHLQAYGPLKDLGDRLAAAYSTMLAGATATRDGLIAADSAAVEAGLNTFFEGNVAYVGLAPEVGDAAEQAIFMKRVLVR